MRRLTLTGGGLAIVAVTWVALPATALAHRHLVRVVSEPAAVAAQARHSSLDVSPGLRLRVTITLRPRHPRALAAYAQAVSTPGSRLAGRYLSPAQFAARFGATRQTVDRVRAALRARGLRPLAVSAGRLSIRVSATRASTVERALATRLRRVRDGGRTVVAATAQPAFGARVAHLVQAVIGLDSEAAPHALAVRAPAGSASQVHLTPAAARAADDTDGPQPCAAATAVAPGQNAYTDNQIADAYGFTPLYQAGDDGTGTTIAVYELEPNDPADIAAYQACYGTDASVSYQHVDGGAGTGAGTDEAAFDIENLIGFAPGARLLVYQGPNSRSGAPGAGPYDTFSTIINQDRAQVISVSWGECEAIIGRSSATAESTLFEQAATEGQTIVAAAGDSGAEDCGTQVPAVDDPSSQRFVLGVGGTTLSALGPPPQETVWNSGGTLSASHYAPGAGGGGVSTLWTMGPAQRDTPSWLGVRNPLAQGAHCHHAFGYCRAVPDVAADADPTTGYLIYWNGADTVAQPSGWQGLGGTSGAAPLWAALIALADADPACQHTPLGFADPAIYRAAASAYGSDFHDVLYGDNDFTGTNHGRFAARVGYDLATGLGTPDASALVASICADAIHLDPLAAQTSAVGARVGLQLRGHDIRGANLTYAATHLPPGVRVSARTGRLTGRPRHAGVYHVRGEVADGQGARAQTRFRWRIGAPVRLIATGLSGAIGQRRLTVVIGGGHALPALRQIHIVLPAGLVTRGGVLRVDGVPRDARQVRVTPHTVTLTLARPTTLLRLSAPVRTRAGSVGGWVRVTTLSGSTGATVLRRYLTEAGSPT